MMLCKIMIQTESHHMKTAFLDCKAFANVCLNFRRLFGIHDYYNCITNMFNNKDFGHMLSEQVNHS